MTILQAMQHNPIPFLSLLVAVLVFIVNIIRRSQRKTPYKRPSEAMISLQTLLVLIIGVLVGATLVIVLPGLINHR